MSETDEKSLSTSLGVEVEGLSSSVSATFSQSITISSSTSVSNTYSIDVADGKNATWILWQVISEIVPVDPYTGEDVSWNTKIIDRHDPGTFLTVSLSLATRATIATDVYRADLTTFNA